VLKEIVFGIVQFFRVAPCQEKGRTNVIDTRGAQISGEQVPRGIKFCKYFQMLVGPKLGSCILVVHTILKWLLEFWKICVPLAYVVKFV
jgi:hypothetical protein